MIATASRLMPYTLTLRDASGLTVWTTNQLPTTIRTDHRYLPRAIGAEAAFVTANIRNAIERQQLVTYFAIAFHFQRHRKFL
ncbi:MAG: hypothetical protein JWM21_3587 [Acidobacteria bacterium]|nr:hypothetical protein [Acidobacteriota bacterium]